eukprot:10288945-Lingulodinium_polyedra.AAC.1
MTRSNRRFATATTRELHARALHAHVSFLARARSAERASVEELLRNCLGAAWVLTAWVLLGRCLGAAWGLLGRCCLDAG